MRDFWKKYRAPLMLLLLTAFCMIAFREVLRPFLVALLLAYLIDPIVGWVNERTVFRRKIPRGLAVLSVYAVFITAVTLFFVLLIPQLVQEVGGLARDIPQTIQDVRHERLPKLNARLTSLFSRSSSGDEASQNIVDASEHMYKSVQRAEEESFIVASLPTEDERRRFLANEINVDSSDTAQSIDRQLVRLREEEGGDWVVLLEQNNLEFQRQQDGSFRLQIPDAGAQASLSRNSFDLVRILDDSLDNLAQTAGRTLTDALSLGQRFLSKVSGVLFATLITFMVAAFVSIDVPHILRFIRSMFPANKQEPLSTLLGELNRGLSGVVRGQLLICLVNGILTGIGLFIFKVKFAFVLAVFAGVMSLIPVFGTLISSVPIVLIALTQGFTVGLAAAGWIAGIHFLEGNFLNPKIIGGAARIHPALVVFALVAGEHVYGILGALLAVPIASLVQTLFLFFVYDRWRDPSALTLSSTAPITLEADPPEG